jgi:hypothetical protein
MGNRIACALIAVTACTDPASSMMRDPDPDPTPLSPVDQSCHLEFGTDGTAINMPGQSMHVANIDLELEAP